jgi:hypothetical protein
MDQQSKPVEKEHIEQNVKNSLMEEHIGENRPRLHGQFGQRGGHHQVAQPRFIPFTKASNGHKDPDDQHYKKYNQIDCQ